MKCTNCGSDFASDQLKCPYCGTVNEHALKLAKELQTYDKEYEEQRNELLSTGTNQVLKRVTLGLGCIFLVIVLIFGGYVAFFQYRYSDSSKYEVTGSRLEKNTKQLETYLENKDYLRAYELAVATDPTDEYFEYYPQYRDELTAIYDYSLILIGVIQSMEEMDAGDNYPGLTDTDVISLQIFYSAPDSEVKEELVRAVDQYLKNYYRLAEEEIETLKNLDSTEQFLLEGSADVAGITKERMVEYFGK